ncbi:MAG: geranylgeranyl diphosphate synthase type I [Myxococcota bacterium]|jgi:geranylgeranyl diphosphate synthase type I
MSVALLNLRPRGGALSALLTQVNEQIERTLSRSAYAPLVDMAAYHVATGGRQFRARLTLTVAAALGVAPERAVPFAAACEILHNATLIHDDLQDGDNVCRGRPSTWARYGPNQAINAGDLMLMIPALALEPSDYPPALKWHLSSAIARRGALTACGQSAEMQINDRREQCWDGWWAAAEGKTGHLFALPIEGAALLAGLNPAQATALADAVLPLGVLFQVQDDVLDLFGDKGRGQVGNDLREGKVSALTSAHIASCEPDADWLDALLQTPWDDVREEQITDAASRFAGSGALELIQRRVTQTWSGVLQSEPLRRQPRLHRELMGAMRGILAPLLDPIEPQIVINPSLDGAAHV